MLVAADVDRTRRLYKALQKHGDDRRMLGAEGQQGREGRSAAGRAAGRAAGAAGRRRRRAADRSARRRGWSPSAPAPTSRRLRGDVERLLLYAAGKPQITLADVREVVSAETAQDDWAVTNAIQRGDAPEALRQLGLALEPGRCRT